MKLRMRMELELLGERELARMLDAALRLWRRISFRVQGTDEFLDHLTAFGCRVNGERVSFPRAVIDRTMERIAEEKRRNAASRNAASRGVPSRGAAKGGRGGADDASSESGTGVIVQGAPQEGWPPSRLTVYTHGQGRHLCDLETNALRPATREDLARWCRMVDALGIEERFHPTLVPNDVPGGSADLHAFVTLLLNSRRPHRVAVYSARMLPFFIEALDIACGGARERDAGGAGSGGGADAVQRGQIIETWCWVSSPFMITRENIEIAMEARRLLGSPLTFGHMPVAGAAGPVTVAGSLVQNTAESLALCAMRLAVDDLTHAITGSQIIVDMKDACHRPAGPDLALHLLAASEMQAYLFGGKPTTSFRQVSAQTVSPQALYEKMLYAAFNVAAGHRKLAVGCLAVSDVGSPVQLVLDLETARLFEHLFREVRVDEEHVGMDTILATVGRGAYFLETEHTARFFREECWISGLLDYRPPLAWARSPRDMIDQARLKARELWGASENMCPLSEEQRRRLGELAARADALVR